jgi:hypothetical protein
MLFLAAGYISGDREALPKLVFFLLQGKSTTTIIV